MARATELFSANTPLLHLSPSDFLSIGDSFQGIQVFGASGCGKTSGSGAALARAMLRQGYGGVVFTVKPDEPDLWTNPDTGYLATSGRQQDLIDFSPESGLQFDFLQYEFTRAGMGAGDTAGLAELFSSVLENADGPQEGKNEQYWSDALHQLLVNIIELAKLAFHKVSLGLLDQLIARAPTDPDEIFTANRGYQDLEWGAIVRSAEQHAITERQQLDLEMTLRYFNQEYPRLAPNTRSSIVSIFTSMADRLLRGTTGDLFSRGEVTISPEQSFDGKVIVVNLPTQMFGPTGRFAQLVFKYMWQNAAMRRPRGKSVRPVFLWCDESQELATSRDAEFQAAAARSARVSTVYLTQNLAVYRKRLSNDATIGLLGNLHTKFFHANGDTETNQWACDTFGKHHVLKETLNYDRRSEAAGYRKSGKSTAAEWDDVVPTKEFVTLKTGGLRNNGRVESLIFSGRAWNYSKTTALRKEFVQDEFVGKARKSSRFGKLFSGIAAVGTVMLHDEWSD